VFGEATLTIEVEVVFVSFDELGDVARSRGDDDATRSSSRSSQTRRHG
jgi:hypothetical protein